MFKTYFLTIKLNLMKKLNSKGRSILVAVSLCVAFMFLGASAVSAQQWVTPEEAVLILKGEIETLDNDYQQAPTNEAKLAIAFRHKYYRTIMVDISQGTEVAQAVNNNAPDSKPTLHSSGMVAFSSDEPNFKQEVQGLVDDATALLTD
jgi:hypothetical protein